MLWSTIFTTILHFDKDGYYINGIWEYKFNNFKIVN